jgi:hypothetical protein
MAGRRIFSASGAPGAKMAVHMLFESTHSGIGESS